MTFFRHAAFALLATATQLVCVCRAEQVLVASLVDNIVYADIVENGDCVSGCTREEHAVAHVSGTPQTRSCELQTITPFDTTAPEPGLLRASVYCEDATGALIEQGTGPCKFDICVDFSWTDGEGDEEGELSYDVVIIREQKPRAPHVVYVDLSVAIDPTASNTNVDSCAKNGTCVMKECLAPDAYTATISLTDSEGDGWVGGVPGYYNLWTLAEVGSESVKTRGTLADNHDSATIKECLPDGDFIFNTTANQAFADDMGWGICNQYGVAGEGLYFSVVNGECKEPTKIPRATAEETDDAAFSYCTLPAPADENDYRTSTCTRLSSGMKIDGVGLFYDDRCNSADLSGCGARSITGCRLCFVDKELWKARFPFERVPDWQECPCCVAATLGVDCATASGGGGTDKGVVIGVSVGIVGVIAIACCLSCAFGSTIVRSFRRLNKKKHAEMELDLDANVASAFPDSPTGGGTINANGHTHGHRGRGNSGHFPIPRFDSIRGRFDSGIFASNNTGAYASNAGAAGVGGGGAIAPDDKLLTRDGHVPTTAQSTPSGTGTKDSPSAPRSTVLDGRLVAKGFTAIDAGRPVPNSMGAAGAGQGGAAGWGLALSGEYPDLEGADPYAIDNTLAAETGRRTGATRNDALE